MKCKKNLLLLSIFVGFASLANAQTFSVEDLERLIDNHHLLKKYDAETRRFKDTPSQIIPIEQVRGQIAKLRAEINELERSREKLVKQTIENVADEESDLWVRLNELSDQIKMKRQQLPELDELEATGGVPPVSRVIPIAREILLDVRKEFSGTDIVLNRLPAFYQPPPRFRQNSLLKFFQQPDRLEFLSEYHKNIPSISLLFPAINQPVLINERVR